MKLRTKSERDQILESIFELYPTKLIELDFETPFQLLTAVMLSAQMTDKGVNKATKKLFKLVKTPADLLKLEPEKVETMLRGVNYYRVKTKHLFATAKKLEEEHHGNIPRTMESIRTLPGVGVKTAKVVLSHLYDMPFIGVDTHIHRVMNRMGIVKTRTPEETDKKLEKLLSEDQKRTMHHAIVLFGRYVCTAKKCKCSETPLAKWCRCEECFEKGKTVDNIFYSILPQAEIRKYVINTCEKEWDLEDFPIVGDDLYESTWKLRTIDIKKIKFNSELIARESFQIDLKPRIGKQIQLNKANIPIPPLILRGKDFLIFDGYARCHLFKKLRVKKCLAYVGNILLKGKKKKR